MTEPMKLPNMPRLMIAGPGELHDDDLTALGRQVIAHYGDVWVALHQQVIRSISELVGTQEPPYVIPGTGTTCLDAAVMNLFAPGQKVIVPNTGFFGIRLKEIATVQGLEVIDVPVETGAPVDVEAVAARAGEADGILCVHVDTSTGVRHPVDELAEVAREAGIHLMVDGIASVGGDFIDVDGMGIDALVTGTQKGLEAPPGLGVIALSARGRERVLSRDQVPSWYLDLKRWDWYRENWPWHPHPVTMPTNLFMALDASLSRILSFGVKEWCAQRAELAAYCRSKLSDLGYRPVPQHGVEASLVVAVWAEDAANIQQHLMDRSIMVSGGLDVTAGKAFRVGLMGKTATREMVDELIAALRELKS